MRTHRKFGLSNGMDKFGKNKENIIQYLKDGCKDVDVPLHFGVELEHFVVKKDTKEAVSYYGENGIEAILMRLKPLYEESTYSEGHLIALGREGIALSLEPAAQMEVSISPQTDVNTIREIYDRFVKEITPILEQYSYEMVTYGYQPKSRVEDLELLPKPRYRFMDAYFAKIGQYGRRMMRGTAATQVSIDYYSEEDFSDKYRIAYALKDVFSYFCSNSPVYEGAGYSGFTLRDEIWAKTDARRVDVASFMIDGTMFFEDYADFVMQTPVIVNKEGTEEYYDERTIGEIAKERIFSQEEISHVLSMVFPMVRAKHFLEIRYADSMPMERVIKYVLILKGLFTNIADTKAWVFGKEFSGLGLLERTEYMLKKVSENLAKEEIEYLKKEWTDGIDGIGTILL